MTGWRDSQVAAGLAPATVNNHLASLSGFLAWVGAQAPEALPRGDPSRRAGSVGLAPLGPRALTAAQVRSLKSVVDRLERFHQLKGRRPATNGDLHGHGRPVRDRAIVYTLLSTGLRREELTDLDVGQLSPAHPAALRAAKRARLTKVRGKGGSQRSVFLSADARTALADYLEHERPRDVDADSTALFVSAASVRSRRSGGRLSPRAINLILERIGAWHDAEQIDPERRISPLRPHDYADTRSPSPCRRRRAPMRTNWNAASATAPSATSPATRTRPRRSPQATSRRCDAARCLRLVTRFLAAPRVAHRVLHGTT